MKYIDEPIRKYIEDASSGQPTPGGGSVAALAGALAGSMMNMVCSFTLGKKAYQEVQPRIERLLKEGMDITDEMLSLVVEDTEVYTYVSKAYGLPKETEEEKKKRSEAIQEACKGALQVPSKVVFAGSRMLSLLRELVDIGNKNLITDTGVATLLSFAAVESAVLNVRINLLFIKDLTYIAEKNEWITKVLKECSSYKETIVAKVNQACGL